MTTRRTRSSSKSSTTERWDFSKEEQGGGGKRYKESDYLVKATKAKPGVSEEKGTPFIEFTFVMLDGKHKGQTFTQRLYNTGKALWITRSFVEAVGESVPARAADWKVIAKLVLNKPVMVTLTDNENPNTGRISSQVSDFLDPDEFDDDDEDADDDDLDDDDLDEDEDDLDEDDDDEDENDDDDEDEDDEPEPPKRRRRASSKSSKSSRSRKAKDDDDDDDLEGIDLDDI